MKYLLFILLAIPGFFLFLFSSVSIIDSLIYASKHEDLSLLSYFVLMVIGILMVLVGTGKLKEWKYSIVFFSIPILIVVYGFFVDMGLLRSEIIDFIVFLTVMLFSIYYLIKWLYDKQKKNKS
jgi:hypothetical protein